MEDDTEYREWLKSIAFAKKDGKVLPTQLTEDVSEDPDDDREAEPVKK
jgi:hypothetical protein